MKPPKLAAWRDVFETGYAFFWDFTEATGIKTNDFEAIRAAVPDAWARHGRAFLETWTPTAVRTVPWALEALGEP